jgi:hypothetical protein
MADDLQTLLESAREHYQEECTWMRFMVDSYEGCGGYQGKVKQPAAGYWGSAAEMYAQFSTLRSREYTTAALNTYLDRYPREDELKFARRIEVAHYLNFIKPIANLYASYLLRKPAKITGAPERLLQWMDRTKYSDGARLRTLLAIVCGYHPVLVDMMPANGTAASAAQSGTADPYLVQLLACHLVDYSADDKGVFAWAKVCVKFTRQADWKSGRQKVERYTIWTPEAWEAYEVVDGHLSTGTPETGVNPFGVVPLAIFRSSVSLDDPVKSESLLASAALEERRLFNLLSEFDEHLRSQVFALLTWPQVGNSAPSVVGTDNALAYDGNAKNAPNYLAPPASVAETYEKRIAATIIEIFRMARVEYAKASGTQSSAQSREQEFEQTNLLICDLASALAQAEKQLLTIVGLGLGISREELDKMVVQPEQDFNTEQLNDEVERVIALLTVRQLGVTFQSELLKRIVNRIMPHLPKELVARIESEIDEGAKRAEQEAQMLAESTVDASGEDDPEDSPEGDTDDTEDSAQEDA